jgi:hypothetical protein
MGTELNVYDCHMTEFHMTEFHMTEFHMTEFHITEFHMTEFHITELFTGFEPLVSSELTFRPVFAAFVEDCVTAE